MDQLNLTKQEKTRGCLAGGRKQTLAGQVPVFAVSGQKTDGAGLDGKTFKTTNLAFVAPYRNSGGSSSSVPWNGLNLGN